MLDTLLPKGAPGLYLLLAAAEGLGVDHPTSCQVALDDALAVRLDFFAAVCTGVLHHSGKLLELGSPPDLVVVAGLIHLEVSIAC